MKRSVRITLVALGALAMSTVTLPSSALDRSAELLQDLHDLPIGQKDFIERLVDHLRQLEDVTVKTLDPGLHESIKLRNCPSYPSGGPGRGDKAISIAPLRLEGMIRVQDAVIKWATLVYEFKRRRGALARTLGAIILRQQKMRNLIAELHRNAIRSGAPDHHRRVCSRTVIKRLQQAHEAARDDRWKIDGYLFVPYLTLIIHTGKDDLRGGEDNLNVRVFIRGQAEPIVVKNINRSRPWRRNAMERVQIRLTCRPTGCPAPYIVRMELETTFRGGISGDNWDMQMLIVKARDEDPPLYIATPHGKENRVFRFTGSQRRYHVPL